MIGDLYNANNVVVGQAAVLIAPAGTALPLPATANMADPFDLTIFQTGTAPFAWQEVGATDQGWKFGANKTTQDIDIEEQSTPVGHTISKQAVTIDGSLSEDISKTLALAFNATLSATAAGASTPGYDTLVFSDSVLYYAVCLITDTVGGFPRWTYAPKWSQLNNTSVDFRRASAKRMYPVSFTTLCPPSQIEVINFTSAHTGA